MWTTLDSPESIEAFLSRFGHFHDGCLREISLATETYVEEDLGMACPGHLDTSGLLFFQSQNRGLPAIELRCNGVSQLRLRPTGENCDSIISRGALTVREGSCRLAVCFVG